MTARHARVRILGLTADITYRLDEDEHARRLAAKTPRALDMGILNRLMNYPEGLPVPADGGKEQHALVRNGLLERDGTDLIRRIRPLLTLDLALVHPPGFRSGLVQAGRFAPFSARGMVLDRLPRDPIALMEAGYWGIGVYTAGPNGELVEAVAPRRFVKKRHTAAGWWFTEQVYRQVAGALGAVPVGGAV